MSELTPQEMYEWQTLQSALGGQSVLDFIPRASPNFVAPQHLLEVANLFARAEYEPIRALISVPPRHGKTETIIHGIPWFLHRHPEALLAYITYSGDLAAEKSLRALDIAARSGLALDPRRRRANRWGTAYEGGLMAVGIGGALTGKGANILIVDDPIKNREEAESKTVRDKNFNWFTSTAMTRIEPGGSVIVVHTRWHEDDLIGRLLRERDGAWEYINLPALDNGGRALWPGRWPASALNVRKEEVGPYDWASLFMGQPRPRGGRLFEAPAEWYEFPEVDRSSILIACDPAATAKNWADHSAIIVAAAHLDIKTRLPRIDILEVHRMQVEIPTLVEKLVQVQRRWNAPVAIEAVGGFKAVPQMLRHMNRDMRIIEVQATADKFTRALPAAAAWNAGRIRLPKNVKGVNWVKGFLTELSTFTGIEDAQDDQVDALAHLVNTFSDHILKSPARVVPMRPGMSPFG